MMRFQLVIECVGSDGVVSPFKHEFEAIDLEHAVMIGRKLVGDILLESIPTSCMDSFYVERMK